MVSVASVAVLALASVQTEEIGASQKHGPPAHGTNELDSVLPMGNWSGALAQAGAEWRLAFRAQEAGPEWSIILVKTAKDTEAYVTVLTTPLRERRGSGARDQHRGQPPTPSRKWRLLASECVDVQNATATLVGDGFKLIQAEFALDAPVYEIRVESVHRFVIAQSQGLGEDAAIVRAMTAVRDAAIQGQCSNRQPG